MKKAALIGLDGMPWDVLYKLFKWNVMPNLRLLADRSVKGILRSTIPPESGPAWTSIATGVNPGKHGVFGFTKPSRDFSDVRLVNSRDVKYLRIHEMVAIQNRKSICVNQLLTYPIKRIKGSSVITDWLSPEIKYSPEIKQYAKNYRGPTLGRPSPKLTKDWDAEYAELSSRVSVVNELAAKTEWDLLWIIYSEPDHLFHRYYDMIMKRDKRVLQLFRELDETFGVIEDIADLLFVVSDHGFSKFNYGVYVNTYLEKLGLVKKVSKEALKGIACQREIDEARIRFNLPKSLYSFLSKLPTSVELISLKIYRQLLKANIRAKFSTHIDPKASKAFAHGYGIYVREKELIKDIIPMLKKEQFIGGVWKKEEVYNGKQLKAMPDIVILPDFEGSFALRGDVIMPKTVLRRSFASHHPDGIIMMYDKSLQKHSWRGGLQVYDVVPTILNYLGLETPVDTDGKAIDLGKAPS
jgi:predicted AlkP superfamily phosphohydrolase/phosphomutase